MLPTPATPSLPTSVYPPSEDSYLLLDVLSSASEVSFLHSRFSPGASTTTTSPLPSSQTTPPSPSPLITDLGTGSGLILAFLAAHAQQILGRPDIACLGLDLSRDACTAARGTVALACREQREQREQHGSPHQTVTGTFLDTAQSDLTSALRPRCVDLLLFNPPYVPTDEVPGLPGDCFNWVDGRDDRVGEGQGLKGTGTEGTERMEGLREQRRREWEDGFARESKLLDVAVAGGVDGMVVTGRLLFGDDAFTVEGREKGDAGAGAGAGVDTGAGAVLEDRDRQAGGGTDTASGHQQRPARQNTATTGLDAILSKDRGVAYVLLSVRNRPKDVMARLRAEMDDDDDDDGGVDTKVDVDDRADYVRAQDGGEGEQPTATITTPTTTSARREAMRQKPRWSSVEIVGATGRKGGIESLVVIRIAR